MSGKRGPLWPGMSASMVLALCMACAFISVAGYLVVASSSTQRKLRQRVKAVALVGRMAYQAPKLHRLYLRHKQKPGPDTLRKWKAAASLYHGRLLQLTKALPTSKRWQGFANQLKGSFLVYEANALTKQVPTSGKRATLAPFLRQHRVLVLQLRRALSQYSKHLSFLWDCMVILVLVACSNAILVVLLFFRDLRRRREAAQLKEDFVSNVSHELRTPLTAVRGAVTLLRYQDHKSLPGQSEKLLDIAARNCLHLSALIDDLLDVQKLHSGAYSPELERCDLAELLELSVHANQTMAQQAQVTLNFEAPDEAFWCESDPKRFRQIIDNLLSNAIKFSPAGEAVQVRLLRQKHCARIEIEDRGPGISPEDQVRIFERFTQTKQSTKQKGTGLGLSICEMLVERLGGEMGVVSTPGQGSTFFVEFALSKST